MSRTEISLILWVCTASCMWCGLSSWAQEEQEPMKDPCAELMAVDMSESTNDEEVASKQLELSMSRLDECLDSLLFGTGATSGDSGDGLGANADGVEAPFAATNQEGEASGDIQDSGTLSGSLDEWDDFLDGVEIELDPLNASSRPTSGERETGDSQSGPLEPESYDTVTGKPQEESADDGDLKGDKVENDSLHRDSNRQPPDPKDEDAVLKQIREAAEKETNPDTKEALWDTYYDYLDSKKRK
ncbi:MAG: hypothetical protein OXG24_09470 [Gammaproteobacteria bacterium]|nr:hypothetical protein [Gammaproteobacteria bacterium]